MIISGFLDQKVKRHSELIIVLANYDFDRDDDDEIGFELYTRDKNLMHHLLAVPLRVFLKVEAEKHSYPDNEEPLVEFYDMEPYWFEIKKILIEGLN